MLRSATKHTSRVLRRSRTIPRVAKSVRQHSPAGTEGGLSGSSKIAIISCVVGLGGTVAYVANYEMKQAEQRLAKAVAKHRFDNTTRMFDEWFDMASSREAVLHKRYNSDGYFNLHKLIAIGNQSKVDQITPAPESVADVIRFFLLWKSLEKRSTIDSADLKKQLGSQFATFHEILNEIRDDEAKGWHQIESDNLNEVIDFLDKISKMEMDR